MPPAAVVCNPDRPVGRRQVLTPPPAKLLAVKNSAGIEVLQPEKLDEIFIKRLRGLAPDLFVVAAYAKIIPQAVLDIPRRGTLGVHPSLLSKYRGASPIQSAILAGETVTGTTIYLMDAKTDHGPILDAWRLELNEEMNYPRAEEALARLGAGLLREVMPEFLAGKALLQPQDESQATFTKKFTTRDGFVEPDDLAAAGRGDEEKANTILRKINAFNPEPGAWTTRNGKRVKLLEGRIEGSRLVLVTTQTEGEKPKRA